MIKKCPYCGKGYHQTRVDSLYCSGKCRVAAARLRESLGLPADTPSEVIRAIAKARKRLVTAKG